MVPALSSHARHQEAEESDQTKTTSLLMIHHWDAAPQPLSTEREDHSDQGHAEGRETRHHHCHTRGQGEYRHPVERLVNEARHDPLTLS